MSDQANEIVVRGNSPMGLQWRLDGMDIPNPNHFGALGTTGVGIIEVYEIDAPESPLVNISTRGKVLTGNAFSSAAPPGWAWALGLAICGSWASPQRLC